jgi:hypothetical protein
VSVERVYFQPAALELVLLQDEAVCWDGLAQDVPERDVPEWAALLLAWLLAV